MELPAKSSAVRDTEPKHMAGVELLPLAGLQEDPLDKLVRNDER
jgi:hypothetical protein